MAGLQPLEEETEQANLIKSLNVKSENLKELNDLFNELVERCFICKLRK